MRNHFRFYFSLLRVHQYVKNLLIFIPAVFGLKIFQLAVWENLLLAFASLSLVASSIYILNDYFDIESDRLHAHKKNRLLASGAVSLATARFFIIVLFLAGAAIAIFLSREIFYLVAGYFILNILYSIKLKHLPIIDVSVIAFSFLIRLFIGSFAAHVPLSMWIIVMTFLLALFIAFAKRRDDVLIYLNSGIKTRRVIDGYNLEFLNVAIVLMGAVLIVAYILYSVSPDVIAKIHSDKLYLTSFFVILGILRFLQITFVENKSGNPTEILLKDRFIQIAVILWLTSFVFILY